MSSATFEGWEKFKIEHPELVQKLPSWIFWLRESEARADLVRNLFLLEAYANQKVEM